MGNGRRANRNDAAAEKKKREFTLLMGDFVKSWNKLIQLAEKGAWDAKVAKKTRKAFEKLIKSEGWIENPPAADAGH